jgi:hypothetical protein
MFPMKPKLNQNQIVALMLTCRIKKRTAQAKKPRREAFRIDSRRMETIFQINNLLENLQRRESHSISRRALI